MLSVCFYKLNVKKTEAVHLDPDHIRLISFEKKFPKFLSIVTKIKNLSYSLKEH